MVLLVFKVEAVCVCTSGQRVCVGDCLLGYAADA